MRQLHVVALSEDGRSVLLATSKTAKTGGFSVPIDARLAAALRGDLPRPGEQQAREIGVTPKEIQARLRAGESPEQIAQSAGVPVARVERFAGPVLSERERIIEDARAAYLSRSRRGASQLPLGDAVDSALAETSSLRPETVTWTARRLDSGHWLVQVSYVARARTRTASWVFDPHTKSVTASDPASAALGHVGDEPAPTAVRRTPAARPAAAPAARKPAKKKAAKKAVKKAVRPPAAAARPAAPARRAAAQPAARPAAAAAPAKRSAAKPAPRPASKPAARPATRPAAKAPSRTAAKPAARKAVTPQPAAVTKRPAKKTAAAPSARPAAKAAPAARTATRPAAPTPAAAKKSASRKTPSRVLRRSAAAEATAATPVVRWGPPVEPVSPPTLRVVPQPAPDPIPEPAPASAPTPTPAPVAPIATPPPAATAAPERPARERSAPQQIPARKKRAAGERAHVPDWADVLLGATPKRSDD